MRHLFTFLAGATLTILTTINLYSQSDFRNGYIIKNNNDTVYGLLDFRGSIANSKICIFKKNANSEKEDFTANDLKAYRYTDSKYYISKSVVIDGKETQIFLEYLINGIVDVYSYRDDKGEHYFIESGDNKLHELKNELKEVDVNNTKYVKESKEYVGMLKYTFRESPEIAKKAESISLDHKSLIKIARDYHNAVCSDRECIIYEKKITKHIVKFGPIIGLNALSISQVSTFPPEYDYLNNSNFKNIIYPSIGLALKFNLPMINEKLFFQYECTFNHTKLKAINSESSSAGVVNMINEIVLERFAVCHTGMIRYEFPKGKIRPVFQIGGSINNYFTIDYKRSRYEILAGKTYPGVADTENPFSVFDFCLNAGFGAVTKIFNNNELAVDIRYQRGSGLIQGLSSNYFILNMAFMFGK